MRTESSSDWMDMMARCSSEGASRVRGLSWGTRTMDERGVRPYADTGGGDEERGRRRRGDVQVAWSSFMTAPAETMAKEWKWV